MLEPGSRSHLMELLRPPAGCKYDSAIGTTFSLDLIGALILPLSFVFFDWERENEDEERFDPLALLEALQLNRNRFSVYCQAGNIRLPNKYSRLLTLLEPCIHEVQAPDRKGVFHPKVWAVRYVDPEGPIRYRVLCLSRNLTFDRSWDTVVALDGHLTNRKKAIPTNRPLAEFFRALPDLCVHDLPAVRRKEANRIADELLRVQFEWPDGFDGDWCRFWSSGLDGKKTTPFEEPWQDSLIVSPFISESVIREFAENGKRLHLVSREESLNALQATHPETLERCESVHFLDQQLSEEETEQIPISADHEVLEGLHAKLFVIDRGAWSHVFSGSFNATRHAFGHNVEFMVEMVGRRNRVGVGRFLAEEKGSTLFYDLLQPYSLEEPATEVDPLIREFDDLFRRTKDAIFDARPFLRIEQEGGSDMFDLRLHWRRPLASLDERVRVRAWPITLPIDRAADLTEEPVTWKVSLEGITPLLGFSMECRIDQTSRTSTFVMNLPLEGAPEDRDDRVVASLLDGKEQLIRYILFLLAAGDENAAVSGDLARLLAEGEQSSQLATPVPTLLEAMLRALHRNPRQVKRVESLMKSLKRAGKDKGIVGEEFEAIWKPIREVASQIKSPR